MALRGFAPLGGQEGQPRATDQSKKSKLVVIFVVLMIGLIVFITFSTLYLDFSWDVMKPKLGAEVRMPNPKFKTFNSLLTDKGNKSSKDPKIMETKASSRFRPDPGLPFSDVFKSVGNTTIKTVKLFIVIFTAPPKFERRKGVRETWLKSCKANPKVECLFFTDSLDSIKDQKTRERILEESRTHKDIHFMPIGSGILFGHRLLYVLQYAFSRYDFEYLMRIDDDFLLCIDHFLWDLDHFPSTKLHWGYLHCGGQGLVYIDEGITMFSNDIVLNFLSQKADKILCHPYGDQTYTIWLQEIGVDRHQSDYAANNRIHHDPPASRDPRFQTMQNICDHYLALHGVYDSATFTSLWSRRGTGAGYSKFNGRHNICPHEPVMLWRKFGGMYHAVPKLCREDANWPQGKIAVYPGRE